jgi:hypothetical protein
VSWNEVQPKYYPLEGGVLLNGFTRHFITLGSSRREDLFAKIRESAPCAVIYGGASVLQPHTFPLTSPPPPPPPPRSFCRSLLFHFLKKKLFFEAEAVIRKTSTTFETYVGGGGTVGRNSELVILKICMIFFSFQ